MAIGDNIKYLRTSHGLSQTELGKIAGVTDKAVSTWEKGVGRETGARVQIPPSPPNPSEIQCLCWF